jgi:L-aminopeptidase/D-esterase-like protein
VTEETWKSEPALSGWSMSHNAITDVAGIQVGHYTDRDAASGVTVVLCLQGAVGGVDVRGSAPGTRETDLLEPGNLVQKLQAVVLSGGSVFGLAAVDGVVRWLAERKRGFPLEGDYVAPIVPAAVLFDLGRGRSYIPPVDPSWGSLACENASSGAVAMGCVGAGTGAVAGGLKGGIGTASEILPSGITVGALVAVNSYGTVVDPRTGRLWEARLEQNWEFGTAGRRAVRVPSPPGGSPARNTTLGIVATDARLDKAQVRKMAQMAHDGIARAVRPAHTLFDGDTIFCLSTGERELSATPGFFAAPAAQALTDLGRAAADTVARAIIHAVLSAETMYSYPAFADLEDRPREEND